MSAPEPEYTADQLEQGIADAIEARDFEAVVPLMYRLVVVDPHRAQVVYDLLTKGEITVKVVDW